MSTISTNYKLQSLKLALAPMAGFTDKAFREVCFKLGADITWSEMVSSEGIARKHNKSLVLAEKFGRKEKNYWVQIFGNNALSMSESAKIIEKKIKPHGIDINMGCPVPKAKKAGYGACQMEKIPEVIEIIKAIKKKTNLPLSVKTRLGVKNSKEILSFAPKLERAGINQLVVHARTWKEMFRGEPDWKIVRKLKGKLKIPVIYNGGIKSPEDILNYAEKAGCDTLMIGQASIGNPWIFKQSKDFIENGKYRKTTKREFKKTVFGHAKLVDKYFGEKGFSSFRGHLTSYLKNMPNASALRSEAAKVKKVDDIRNILEKI